MHRCDVVILGAGINGLMLAYQLEKSGLSLEGLVLEKSSHVGDETTGRNSGVLHAGLYYKKGSLKHELCLAGNAQWEALSEELGAPIQRLGKYVFSHGEEDQGRLEKLFHRALDNGVPGMRWADEKELKRLRGYVEATSAIFSPQSGTIDISSLSRALALSLGSKVDLVKELEALDLESTSEGVVVKTEQGDIHARYVINAGGLSSVKLRRTLGLNDLEDYWLKGCYLVTHQDFYRDSLLYPLPLGQLKGLGIHTNVDSQGVVRFGPNSYEVSQLDYSFDESAEEEIYRAVEKTFKSVDLSRLRPDYCGIRPKVKHRGEIYDDFWIKGPKDHGIPGYIELCGMDSPGITAAPAVAEMIIHKWLGPSFG